MVKREEEVKERKEKRVKEKEKKAEREMTYREWPREIDIEEI